MSQSANEIVIFWRYSGDYYFADFRKSEVFFSKTCPNIGGLKLFSIMANQANNEVVLNSFKMEIVTDNEFATEQAKQFAGVADQIISVATAHYASSETAKFIKDLPTLTEILGKILKPTEGFQKNVYTVEITRTGIRKDDIIVRDNTL